MADDRQQPRDAAGSGGLPDVGEDFDQTSEFDPLAEKDEDAGYPGGASAGEQPARRPAPDDTAPLPADETATNEPADDTAPLPVTPGTWSGRAEVPRPEQAAVGAAPPEWDEAGERPSHRWCLPILVGILALFLLGVLTYGIWLIVRSNEGGTGPVTPSPSAATATSATPRPTSAAPTTGPPTPSPTSTAAATVPMPSLVGQPEATARAALDRLGLVYRLEFRTSDRTPGTVIETEPGAGTTVPLGTQVTLVIAEAPTAPAPTATPTATPTVHVTATG